MKKKEKQLPIAAYKLKKQLESLSLTIKSQKKRIIGWQRVLSKSSITFGDNEAKKNLRNCELEIKQARILYRHMHIAYSELLGNSRSKIEHKNTYAKDLSEELIQNFKK